jgi:hypothetical protein
MVPDGSGVALGADRASREEVLAPCRHWPAGDGEDVALPEDDRTAVL